MCRYLCGILKRIATNNLYCKKDENSYSSKKFYYHATNTKKTVNLYEYINYFYLDEAYNNENSTSDRQMLGLDILDMQLLKKNQLNNVESHIFKTDDGNMFRYMMKMGIITEDMQSKMQRRLEGKKNQPVVARKTVFSKVNINQLTYSAIAEKDGKLWWKGDFLDYAKDIMISNDRLYKFNRIKKKTKIEHVQTYSKTKLLAKAFNSKVSKNADSKYEEYTYEGC